MKLVEIPARYLADQVVERWLEERGGLLGDAIRDFRQRVAEANLRRHVGEGITRGLAGQCARAGKARVDLDDPIIAALGIERVRQRFPRRDLIAESKGFVTSLPLAVLINQSTAGPAELIASSVAGNKRGDVLGTRSFGIGVYQKMISLDD